MTAEENDEPTIKMQEKGIAYDEKEHEKELRCYPAVLTAAEVAEVLRVSTKTVYKLIKEKSLPAVKVGRENRIAKSHLINYLRQIDKGDSNPKVYLIEKLKIMSGLANSLVILSVSAQSRKSKRSDNKWEHKIHLRQAGNLKRQTVCRDTGKRKRQSKSSLALPRFARRHRKIQCQQSIQGGGEKV